MNANSSLSQRQLRVGEVVRRALVDILLRGELIDPDLDGRSITVPEVRMSSDLMIAVCYVIPLGGDIDGKVVKIMARHARFLRGALARRINLRYMPNLRFCFDHSFDYGSAMDRLFSCDQVMQDVSSIKSEE